jgi:ribosomal protein S18 acetylase RimI-like enzyme
MPSPGLRFREARPEDAQAVARLHADSWQRHYRGAYSDAFLSAEAPEYLEQRWKQRLAAPSPQAITLLAESDGVVVGLVHTVLDDDPVWGGFIDNLHVQYALKRQRVGSRLMALSAQAVRSRSASWGLHLWVLEQNTAAQAFYAARGGKSVERKAVPPPGGDPARLNGMPYCLRFAWLDAPPCACGERHSWEVACTSPDVLEG